MPIKPLSDMTAQSFVEITAALGLKFKDLAKALNRSGATISQYATGKAHIPQAIADELHNMLVKRRRLMESWAQHTLPTVASIIVATNEQRASTSVESYPRLVKRAAPLETRTYPPYRTSFLKQSVLVAALDGWYATIHGHLTKATDERARRELILELADTKALRAAAKAVLDQGAPYDNCITWSEWHVISRALRNEALVNKTPSAWAMYQHWRRHKGSGYPRA